MRAALERFGPIQAPYANFFRLVNALEVVTDPAVSERFMQFASRFTDALAPDALVGHGPSTSGAAIAFVTSTVVGGVLRGW